MLQSTDQGRHRKITMKASLAQQIQGEERPASANQQPDIPGRLSRLPFCGQINTVGPECFLTEKARTGTVITALGFIISPSDAIVNQPTAGHVLWGGGALWGAVVTGDLLVQMKNF